MSRLVVLRTSPRLPPGLLSRSAWQALDGADLVLAADVTAPIAAALAGQGLAVTAEGDASAARLLALAATRDVVWLLDEATEEPLLRDLAQTAVRRSELAEGSAERRREPEIEILVGSFDPAGARLLDLVDVMDRLRRECPWDREQTHESLLHYLLEETYETVEAVENGDYAHLSEELGDLLLQVVFHARIAAEQEESPFTIDDVAGGIVEKLVRRHPHVFSDTEVSGAGEVESNWEAIKAAEKARESAMEGIPLGLPALSLAHKVAARARRAGLGLPVDAGLVSDDAPDSRLADLLLAVAATAERRDLDPEQLLRRRTRALMEDVRAREQRGLAGEAPPRR
jgi:XTP/dITP diphosphohydrolase